MIVVVRHGETEWSLSAAHEPDRPAADRGGRDAAPSRSGRMLAGRSVRARAVQPAAAGAGDVRAGRIRRAGRALRRPARVGLRRVRGADDARRSGPSGRTGTCGGTAVPVGEQPEEVGGAGRSGAGAAAGRRRRRARVRARPHPAGAGGALDRDGGRRRAPGSRSPPARSGCSGSSARPRCMAGWNWPPLGRRDRGGCRRDKLSCRIPAARHLRWRWWHGLG